MKDNAVIKHVKIKNSGILFELLTRQLTSDILNGVEKSKAKELIERYFNRKTDLGKEYLLYQTLTKQRFDSEPKALSFIDEVITAHTKLNKSELRKSKYNLIREIKENYVMDDFFKNKINNYKILASIYKIFQAKSLQEGCSPLDFVDSKFTIVENLIQKSSDEISETESDSAMKEYEKQNKDLRLLAYKIMTERFNEKYRTLNERQRLLIKEYINNISSANSLKNYILSEIVTVKEKLSKLSEVIADNKVSQIKVKEVVNQLESINSNTQVGDSHVMAMLNVYELIDELVALSNQKTTTPAPAPIPAQAPTK